jgi:type I site-specific restriction endonuclease
MDMTPEAQARGGIDAALAVAGWVVQDYRKVDLGASSGVALREVPLKSGRCDYLLLVNRMRVRIVESTGISNLQRTTRLRQSILQKVFFAKSLTH